MTTATTPQHRATRFPAEQRILALKQYREMVKDAAGGKVMDFDDSEKIARLCERIGFSPSQFEIHVGWVERYDRATTEAKAYKGKAPEELRDALDAATVQVRQQRDKLRDLQRARFILQEQLNASTQAAWEADSTKGSCPEVFSDDLEAVIQHWTPTDDDGSQQGGRG